MSVLRAGSIVQVRAWCVNNEQAAVNTWYYDVTAIIGAPTTLELITALDVILAPLYKPTLTSDSVYRGLQGVDIAEVPRPVEDSVIVNAGDGTQAGVVMARQSTGINTWRTALAGPKNRGRTYWPFPPGSLDTTGGVPGAGYLADLTSLCTALLSFTNFASGGNSATVALSIYSRVAPIGPTPVTSFTVRSKYATIKKRGSYGRANSSPI